MKHTSVLSSEIAKLLGKELHGKDIPIYGPASLAGIGENTLVFAKKYKEDIAEKLNLFPVSLAICCPEYAGRLVCSYILSDNPRLDFIYALRAYFVPEHKAKIHPTAYVEPGAQIGEGVSIGAFSYIGKDVLVGDGTEILQHVIITGKVRIGRDCRILEGACIGCESMGCERNEDGVPIEMPQLGGVCIGDRVKVGAGAKIARGALDNTVIGDDVKLDVNTYIAHNARIGDGSIFTANSEVSGSVKVGKQVYFAPGIVAMNGITIGDNAYIGIGSVVLRNVKPNAKMFGNPAKELDF